MAPTTYADVLARNIRAARTRLDLGQEAVAARMRGLGYDAWIRQTVGSTERGKRRPSAEEIFALAYVLQTTISSLMAPRDEDKIVDFPSGATVSVESVQKSAIGRIDDSVWWHDDEPVFPHSDSRLAGPLDVVTRMREGRWPPDEAEG